MNSYVRRLYRNGGSVVLGLPKALLNICQLMPGKNVWVQITRPGVFEIMAVETKQQEIKDENKQRELALTQR